MNRTATKTSECITKDRLLQDSKTMMRRFFAHTKVGHHMYLPHGNLRALEKLVEEKVDRDYLALDYQSGGDITSQLLQRLVDSVKESLDVTDAVVMKVEAVIAFMYNMTRVDGMASLIVALTSLCHGLSGKSVTSLTSVMVGRFQRIFGLERQSGFMKTLEDGLTEFDLDSFESFIDFTREKIDLFDEMKDVPLIKKFHKFLTFCASYSLFDCIGIDFDFLGYDTYEAKYNAKLSSTKHGKMSFAYAFFDFITLFLKQGIQCVKIGSWEPMIHSSGTHADWVNSVILLKQQEKLTNDSEPHGFDIFDYRARLETAIERGEAIVRVSQNAPKYLRGRYQQMLGELLMLKTNDISKRSAQRDRPAPFGVMLYGGSSLGKSTLINILFQYYAQRFGLSNDTASKYTRNPGEKYWNNFSSSQWCIVMDDIAAQSAALSTADPSLQEIIGVMNNVAYQPDQASIEDKGRTPMRAELVIATTNTEHLNAHAYFSCPLAVQRRLPYIIEVKVKTECATNGMLDHTKAQKKAGEYPDFWEFTVKQVVPASDDPDNRKGKTKVIERFSHIAGLCKWFGDTAHTHREVQKRIGEEDKDTAKIEVCPTCGFPMYICVCGTNWADSEQQALLIGDDSTPYQRYAHFVQAARLEDWKDLCYTIMHILFWTIYQFCGFFIGGVLTYGIFYPLLPSWVTDGQMSARIFGFVIRRLSCSVRNKLKDLLPYIKFFGVLGAGTICARYVHYKASHKYYYYTDKNGKLHSCKDITELLDRSGGSLEPEQVLQHKVSDYFKPQNGDVEEIGSIPQAVKEQRQNVWYKNDFVVSSFDVSSTSLSWKGLAREDLRKHIRRNVKRVEIQGVEHNDGKANALLALGGQLYCLNAYALPRGDVFTFNIMQAQRNNGVTTNVSAVVTRSQMYFPDKSDVVYVVIPNLPPAKDLTCLVPEDSFGGIYEGEYIGYNKDMIPYTNEVQRVVKQELAVPHGTETMFVGHSKILTEKGDCGTPLIVFSGHGPVLVGIHSMGNQAQIVSSARLCKHDIDAAVKSLKALMVQCGTPLLNSSSAYDRQVTELAERSPFRYLETGFANVYGSLTGPRVSSKSMVRPTFFAEAVKKRGYTVKFGAPRLRGWQPWRLAAVDMTDIPTAFRCDVVEAAVEGFTNDIISLLSEDDLKQVHVYDMFTAINGAANVAYVDKMNRSTSAGFPWNTSKRKFIEAIPEQNGLPDPVAITPEIKERVQVILDRYHAGERYMPVFNGNLKDEALKFAKIEIGKIRMFGGAPMDWSIVNRMFMLPVIRLMQDNRYIFEGAPGTITQSREWDDMFGYLTHFGKDRIVAGDYKAFDKSMSPVFILAAFRIMRNICEVAGYSAEDLKVIDGLAVDTAFPLFNMNGD